MKIPDDFTEMNDDHIAAKYPAAHRPLAMFTDPSGQIDIGATQVKSYWADFDLMMVKEFHKASIKNLYDSVHFYQDTIIQIKNEWWIQLRFYTARRIVNLMDQEVEVRKYVHQLYKVKQKNLIIISLYCPIHFKDEWEKKGVTIMETVRLKSS